VLLNAEPKRIIQAAEVRHPPKIDGDLSDPAWTDVAFQDGFLQREPAEGSPGTERTEVGLAYNAGNLYIGVKCFDSESGKIIAREMRRDAFVDNDDYFEFILDTYHDRRSGFYFIINPNGVKRDAMMANEGRQYNPAWDGIWQCRTSITEEGWTAEIAIPWKTLRFARSDTTVWGINFARMIRRKNEHVYWQLIPRELGKSGIFSLSEAGELHGLKNIQMGGNLELRPYFLGGLENDLYTGYRTDRVADAGMDAKIALTANLTLDLTVNTDFAQVEADEQQVNLSRFSLYFPEKREFFLEGAEIFSFAGSGGMRHYHGGGSSMDLFYSRRIGLVNGREARILGGAKMVGKIGRYQVGFLNMLTDETRIETGSGSEVVPRTNHSVIRLRRDILTRGSIGFMLLNKDEINSGTFNRTLGLDGYFPLTRHFSLSGYTAGTLSDTETFSASILSTKKNLAANIALNYNSDLWSAGLDYTDIGVRFNPELGFVRRVDYRYTSGSLSYSPRPANQRIVRQLSCQISGGYRTDHGNRMLDTELDASFSLHFQDSARLSFTAGHEQEYIGHDWVVRSGHLIPKGTYRGFGASASFQTDQSRNISGSLNLGWSHYYGGGNFQFGASSGLTPLPRTRMETSYRYNHVDLPTGEFYTHAIGFRGFYFFSTELYIKAYLQLNDDKLLYAGRENIVSNIFLRWIFRPGSDLYLVYNDSRLAGPGEDEITNRTFLMKAAFFWRR